MKKQTKLTAVITSFALLMLTLATTTAGTLAWFTRGTEATASGFDFTASAASGIQISTDASTWKSSISALDFDLTPGQPQENSRLSISGMEPVSTDTTLNSGSYDFYGATSGNGNFTLAADTSNYLVFDLYFLNQGAEDLTLSLTSSASVTDGTTDQDTSLATRVGFVVEGSHNDPATVIGLSNGISSYVWEPNSLTRSASALASGATNNAKYNYNAISGDNGGTPITTTDAYGLLSSGAYSTPVSTTKDMAIGDSPAIGTIPGAAGGQITKMKVFVWMEGQDVDCNNGTSAGDVDIALAFDSGAAATTLASATASSFADGDNLTITGGTEVGATYTTYILQTVTDVAVSLDYIQYFATGTVNNSGTDITNIGLTPTVASGTYDVVVLATLTGSIGSRTATSIILT